jgi:hypothetical protein
MNCDAPDPCPTCGACRMCDSACPGHDLPVQVTEIDAQTGKVVDEYILQPGESTPAREPDTTWKWQI